MTAREVIKVSDINKFLSEKTGINSCNNSKTYYCEECPRLSDDYKGALIDPSTKNCLFVTPADFFTPASMVRLMEWLTEDYAIQLTTTNSASALWSCSIDDIPITEFSFAKGISADTPQEAVARAAYVALGGEKKGD